MKSIESGFDTYEAPVDRYQSVEYRWLRRELGACGLIVWEYISNEITRGNGYCLDLRAGGLLNIADYFFTSIEKINTVLKLCASLELCEIHQLQNGVVTSADIQQRYLDRMCRSRRVGQIPDDIRLVNLQIQR